VGFIHQGGFENGRDLRDRSASGTQQANRSHEPFKTGLMSAA